MVILGEKHGDTHVLHMLIGEETEFQFDLTGQSIMDITNYMKDIPHGEKCVILLNRCNSEEDVLARLREKQMRIQAEEYINKQSESNPEEPLIKSKKKESPDSGTTCPECNAPNSAIVKGNKVLPCESCQKIAIGVKKHKIPPMPNNKELEKIANDLINKKEPKKKKSLFGGFLGNNSEEKT